MRPRAHAAQDLGVPGDLDHDSKVGKRNIAHIWWEFPAIRELWDLVLKIFHKITGIGVVNSPSLTLLSLFPGQNKDFLLFLGYGSLQPPSLLDWVREAENICRME